jgi:triosephosphate isomerase
MFPERGAGIPILYGGSVNKENAVELIKQPEIDGLFIGRAAWDASRFNEIIRAVLPIWRSKTSKLLSV